MALVVVSPMHVVWENEQNDHVEDDLSENEEGSGSGQDGGAAGGDGGSENSSSQDDEQPESETNSESKDDEEESDALVEENEVKEKNHQVNDSEDVCQEETMCEDSVGDGSQNQSGEPVMNCEIVNASRSNVFMCVQTMYCVHVHSYFIDIREIAIKFLTCIWI